MLAILVAVPLSQTEYNPPYKFGVLPGVRRSDDILDDSRGERRE